MALHLAAVISTPRHAFERYICPESVESTWIVGAVPVICSANEADFVISIDEMTESTNTDVLVQFTDGRYAACQSGFGYQTARLTHCYRIHFTLNNNRSVLAAKYVDNLANFCVRDLQVGFVLLMFLFNSY